MLTNLLFMHFSDTEAALQGASGGADGPRAVRERRVPARAPQPAALRALPGKWPSAKCSPVSWSLMMSHVIFERVSPGSDHELH